MQQNNPTGQGGNPDQNKNVEEERKKIDDDLKQGKITQAEYFKKMKDLGLTPTPPGGPAPGATQQPPQLPPAPTGPGGVSPITPISPISPQQAGPKEEIPPIGQALAIGSEDIEVVECYKCNGLITVTTQQRPVIIACPTCGTKGEVTGEELESEAEGIQAPKPTDGVTVSEDNIFKFKTEEEKQLGPKFGSSYESDLASQDKTDKQKAAPSPKPQPIPQPKSQPSTQPSPTPKPAAAPTPTPSPTPKPEDKDKKSE
jgi:DNA-directed RNA polymerase subunit M/transcription elongation factor TFIIS